MPPGVGLPPGSAAPSPGYTVRPAGRSRPSLRAGPAASPPPSGSLAGLSQLALLFRPWDDLELRMGYRLLEGGSDGGGSVYTFSMFHYATAGLRYRF